MPEFQPRHSVPPVALRPVDCSRGAPMGWSHTPDRVHAAPCNVALRRIPLADGYDPAGFYYGLPSDLWEALADAEDSRAFRFRAGSQRDAESIVRQYYPAAMLSPSLSLESFLSGYLAAAEWLMRDEMDREGTGDVREGVSRGWTRASLRMAERDCAAFISANPEDLAEYETATGRNMESAGHDFWLTRNRHGVGFWDRGKAECLERLTKAANGFRECDSLMLRNGYMTLS